LARTHDHAEAVLTHPDTPGPPGTRPLNTQVPAGLVKRQAKAITCPGDLKAVEGTKMRCQLEASNGSKIGLTLTVTSVKDNNVKFHISVDPK
jgi:hypothetical protein